jgi:hypothetical protein
MRGNGAGRPAPPSAEAQEWGTPVMSTLANAAAEGLRRYGSQRRDQLTGGPGDDTLYGLGGPDLLRGGDGADLIQGGGDDDQIGWLDTLDADREAGDDTLAGGDGYDLIGGGDGHDRLLGGAGRDTLFGGDGNDTLVGGADANRLVGDAGDDWLVGGAEGDVAFGGAEVNALFGDGPDTQPGRDTIAGGGGGDSLRGGGGEDMLLGQAGSDTLHGETGADTLMGGAAGDVMLGGAGADVLGGEAGDDLLIGGLRSIAAGAALLPDFDPGADILSGGAGNDTLLGGGGADRLMGGIGRDLLRGGGGGDTLTGGTGIDTLTGGAGDDLFLLRAGDAVTITDFRTAAPSTVTLTFDELEAATTLDGAYGGLAWGVVDIESGDLYGNDGTALDGFNPVTAREGGSIRAVGGTLGISDPDGRLFVVEAGTVIKSVLSTALVTTFRDGVRLESFSLPYADSRPDLGTALAGMLPADHIEIEGRTNIGNMVMSVPLDAITLRYVEAAELDRLQVGGPALEAGLLASATDGANGVELSFGGVSVTLTGQTAAAASSDWFA